MPTVLRFEGLRVVIYPNDHRPAHVHVIGRGYEAMFNLNCPTGPADVRENYGFPRPEVRHIERMLRKRLAALCAAWEVIHGSV
jgi:Domain of unknown function (DUF4160)